MTTLSLLSFIGIYWSVLMFQREGPSVVLELWRPGLEYRQVRISQLRQSLAQERPRHSGTLAGGMAGRGGGHLRQPPGGQGGGGGRGGGGGG